MECMPCAKCGRLPNDHDSCGCPSYVESMFECQKCGNELNESQARGGHDLCDGCAKKNNSGNPML